MLYIFPPIYFAKYTTVGLQGPYEDHLYGTLMTLVLVGWLRVNLIIYPVLIGCLFSLSIPRLRCAFEDGGV